MKTKNIFIMVILFLGIFSFVNNVTAEDGDLDLNATWTDISTPSEPRSVYFNGTDYLIQNDTANVFFNLTVCANGTTGNITRLNITLPSGFSFIGNSNGTGVTAPVDFINESQILSWNKSQDQNSLIPNGTCASFWFNSTIKTDDGEQKFVINATNSTNWTGRTLSVIVDAYPPSIELTSPADGSTDLDGDIDFNFIVTDNYAQALNCSLYIDGEPNQNEPSVPAGVETTFSVSLTEGTYEWNITCEDNVTNKNWSETWSVSVSPPIGLDVNATWTDISAIEPRSVYFNGTNHIIKNDTANVFFNLTVCANGTTENITRLNITLPAEFSFIGNSNGTGVTAPVDFINEGQILSWNKSQDDLIPNGTCASFWFNASISAGDGEQKFVINATNSTNWTGRTLSVIVDAYPPSIELTSPGDGSIDTDGDIDFKFTTTDNYAQALNCSLYIDGELNQNEPSVLAGVEATFSVSLTEGTYEWNITCEDNVTNKNWSGTWSVIVSESGIAEIRIEEITPDDDGFISLNNPEFSVTLENTGTKATSTCMVYWNLWKGTRGNEYDKQTVEKECSVPAEDSQTVTRSSGDVITETGSYVYWVRINYDGKWYPSNDWYPIDPEGAEFTVEENPFGDKIILKKGQWTLVSVPKRLDPNNRTKENVFGSNYVYFYNADTGNFEEPVDIEPCYGYWVLNETSDQTILLDFKDFDFQDLPSTIELKQGWNLIGHTSAQEMDVSEALISIDGKYSTVLSYTGSSWEVYISGTDNSGSGRFSTMESNSGYWVYVTEDCMYSAVSL